MCIALACHRCTDSYYRTGHGSSTPCMANVLSVMGQREQTSGNRMRGFPGLREEESVEHVVCEMRAEVRPVDLVGEQEGLPLHRRIGGLVRAACAGCPVELVWTIGDGSRVELLEATRVLSRDGSRIDVRAPVGEIVVLISSRMEAHAYVADGRRFPGHVVAALSESELARLVCLMWEDPDGGTGSVSWLEPNSESVTVLLLLMRSLLRKAALREQCARELGLDLGILSTPGSPCSPTSTLGTPAAS
mmetsp:Transcript_53372/g.149877  ORF Transcript_53372/g.149877 Transcript_53372/m.149877 type:complete len:247 (+) Transcript_53372:63-803(+)